MDPNRRKQLKSEYKRQLAVGGVYAIVCSGNQQRLIKSTVDIEGIRQRFAFAQAIQGCPDPALQSDWEAYGTESFSLVVLEELKMKEDQSPRSFAEDVKTLRELWLEKDAAGETH